MPDKKIDPVQGNPSRFQVPVNQGIASKFPDQAPVTIILPQASVGVYDVYQKDIPDILLDPRYKNYQGNPIHWLNNFGLKLAGAGVSGPFVQNVPTYFIQLNYIPGKQYVYYDGTSIQPWNTSPVTGNPSQVQGVLSRGDPSIGWG
jgi:hypothetical protein